MPMRRHKLRQMLEIPKRGQMRQGAVAVMVLVATLQSNIILVIQELSHLVIFLVLVVQNAILPKIAIFALEVDRYQHASVLIVVLLVE